MKKFVVLVTALALGACAYAQPRAVGGRVGSAAEVSYQHGIGSKNMVTIDAGLVYDVCVPNVYQFVYSNGAKPWLVGVEAVATFDWIFPIKQWKNKGEWNWYAGVGLGAGYLRGGDAWSKYYNDSYDSGFVGVAGRIGVEYNFWFPFQLAFDWRPVFAPLFVRPVYEPVKTGYYVSGLYAGAFCLSVRYLF